MNAITSAAAFFRAAKDKRVRKTVTGVATVETWPEHKANILRQLREQGCDEATIREDDKALHFGAGQFVMIPKLKALEEGTLQVRSADYGFLGEGAERPTWGDKKGATVEDGKLVKRYDNGMTVTFELLEG